MEEIYCFAGNPLDRVSDRRRDEGWVKTLLDAPTSLVLPLCELKPRIPSDGAATTLDWESLAAWRPAIEAGARIVLLGLADGAARFALDATDRAQKAGGFEDVDVRALAPVLPAGEAAILAEARALLDWHARHSFCAQCGTPSTVAAGGWTRHCPNCRAHHFPRVDPVVIMLAVKGERCLLGRNRRRAGARFSCLAGFIEPGETLEEAVRRETFEEAGVQIGRVRYLASQPWPFPSTLMMGFLAEALSEEIVVDAEEIAEARWFTRQEVRGMVARAAAGEADPAQPSLPPPLAIAHQICRRWAAGFDDL